MSRAEEFIEKNINNGSSDIIGWDDNGLTVYQPWLTPNQAKKAVEIARQEIYEWLKEYVYIYSDDLYLEGLIRDLKRAMKNE
jgi:hypothetical protein